MHKGFPEMISYLMGKPEYYASHSFVHLFLDAALGKCERAIEVDGEMDARFQPVLRPGQVLLLGVLDYKYRPIELESFPLYLFVAACDVRAKWVSSRTLDWQEFEPTARIQPCLHPSYEQTVPIFHSQASWLPVKRSFGGSDCKWYPYYVSLRTDTAWRVPVLYGKFPTRLHPDSPAREQGYLALFMMLLFRPHRDFYDEVVRPVKPGGGGVDDFWLAIHKEYRRWREGEIDDLARPFYHRSPPTDHPPAPQSREWWACETFMRLRNMDLVMARHTSLARRVPDMALGLPIVEEHAMHDDDESPRGGAKNDRHSHESADSDEHESERADACDESDSDRGVAKKPFPTDKIHLCSILTGVASAGDALRFPRGCSATLC